MSTHYIDISVLPDPEFNRAPLMGALLSKLHRGLVQINSRDIGISFPKHINAPPSQRTLGSVLRLHGTPQALARLLDIDWLRGMHDHVALGTVSIVPEHTGHRVVQRRQFKTSVARLRRRRMQRKGETAEQAAAAIPMHVERKPDLPFANLRSMSTGETFALFVQHGPILPHANSGEFNSYGLSQSATIPWF